MGSYMSSVFFNLFFTMVCTGGVNFAADTVYIIRFHQNIAYSHSPVIVWWYLYSFFILLRCQNGLLVMSLVWDASITILSPGESLYKAESWSMRLCTFLGSYGNIWHPLPDQSKVEFHKYHLQFVLTLSRPVVQTQTLMLFALKPDEEGKQALNSQEFSSYM